MVTGLSGCSSVSVAVTVASVGPYELRMRRPGRYQRATRFCGQASPPTSRMRSLRQILLDGREQGRAAGHHGDVALAQKVRELVADQARARAAPGTSVAPAISGTQISSIEKSKAMVMPW